MKAHFKPKTKLGKWSAWLIVAFGVFMGIFQALVASGQRSGETFFSNPSLTAAILPAGTAGIAAFIAGLVSIIRDKERSASVIIAVVIGLFVLIFALGEVLYPH